MLDGIACVWLPRSSTHGNGHGHGHCICICFVGVVTHVPGQDRLLLSQGTIHCDDFKAFASSLV